MKRTDLASKTFVSLVLILGTVFGNISMVFGQGLEDEPNHPCPTAENFDSVALPFTLNGSLDSTPESPDVDFFRFSGTPGAFVRVDLEAADTGNGTLGDPFLGLFDSACNLTALNDDRGTLNSRLVFAIPADGIFILAATVCCDSSFTGGGVGTYQLTITRFSTIGRIHGRIVDAIRADPLPGDTDPFAFVQLLRCDDSGCFEVSNSQPADTQGRFQISLDFEGQPLEVGTYQVVIYANQYHLGQTDPFGVVEGEHRDVGEVRLRPFPVRISEIRPCGDLPPEGGTCSYSVRVTNPLDTAFDGAAWSGVSSYGIGSLIDSTSFQTANPKRMTLRPGASRVVQFEFEVPRTVRDFAWICTAVYVGEDRLQPSFNTVGESGLFCISKGSTGVLSVVPEKQAQKMFRQLNGRMVIPPKQK